jgi:hypothetical protein
MSLNPTEIPKQNGAQTDATPPATEEESTGLVSTLANHKGKLAMGAAAMLGLAVFYRWREGRLAQDDPEEYARLQRLKAAVDVGDQEN